jgi:hypothetical protein
VWIYVMILGDYGGSEGDPVPGDDVIRQLGAGAREQLSGDRHRPGGRAPARGTSSLPAVAAAAAVTVSGSSAMPRMVAAGADRTG